MSAEFPGPTEGRTLFFDGERLREICECAYLLSARRDRMHPAESGDPFTLEQAVTIAVAHELALLKAT